MKDLFHIITLFFVCGTVSTLPMHHEVNLKEEEQPDLKQNTTARHGGEGEVLSVRVTSSVATDRGNGKQLDLSSESPKPEQQNVKIVNEELLFPENQSTTVSTTQELETLLEGANIEYIKQLHAKKEARGLQKYERIHPFQDLNPQINYTTAPYSDKVIDVTNAPTSVQENYYEESVPLARSVPSSLVKNKLDSAFHIKPVQHVTKIDILTTVSFNIVHNTPRVMTETETVKTPYVSEEIRIQHPKVYSKPAKVYSEPAKYYSEPAKIYSEPAKFYSEPAKVYSEPAKVYSEPAKFYSEPASLHLDKVQVAEDKTETDHISLSSLATTISPTTIKEHITKPDTMDHQPEKNYEVDEKVSVMTDGRSHGVQESNPENCKDDNCKVGYVVEGRHYRKYRVEEKTSDGFIVGEYGVVRNEDGALRGVRYTADGDASPRLIYDALMKFLQL